MNLLKRMRQPTPRFFRKIRNIGITAATIGGAIITAPIALPAAMVTVAGYVAVAGSVATAISQAVTEPGEDNQWMKDIEDKGEYPRKW